MTGNRPLEVLLAGAAPILVGVLNVTPDSFSDGGLVSAGGVQEVRAIQRGLELQRQGAAIIDVGGEASSFHRPGIYPIPPDEQIRRVVPIIRGLRRGATGERLWLSIDTRSAVVARAALHAGADIINDISAGTQDGEMFALAAEHRCPIILMHHRPEAPGIMPEPYCDVVGEVRRYLLARAAAAMAQGVKRERIVLDPGLGFGKTVGDNWKLLGGVAEFVGTGYPVALGASRKRFLAAITGEPGSAPGGPGLLAPAVPGAAAAQAHWHARDLATALVTVLAAARGVRVHRVHNVALAAQALAVVRAAGA